MSRCVHSDRAIWAVCICMSHCSSSLAFPDRLGASRDHYAGVFEPNHKTTPAGGVRTRSLTGQGTSKAATAMASHEECGQADRQSGRRIETRGGHGKAPFNEPSPERDEYASSFTLGPPLSLSLSRPSRVSSMHKDRPTRTRVQSLLPSRKVKSQLPKAPPATTCTYCWLLALWGVYCRAWAYSPAPIPCFSSQRAPSPPFAARCSSLAVCSLNMLPIIAQDPFLLVWEAVRLHASAYESDRRVQISGIATVGLQL